MRRKGTVLVVDADSTELSHRAFVLGTRGYAVLRASSAESALELLWKLPAGTVALLVAELDLEQGRMDAEALLHVVREIDPAIRTIVTDRKGRRAVSAADCYLPLTPLWSMGFFLDRVAAMVNRRRTPVMRNVPVPAPTFLQCGKGDA